MFEGMRSSDDADLDMPNVSGSSGAQWWALAGEGRLDHRLAEGGGDERRCGITTAQPGTSRVMDDLVGPARGHDPGVTRRAAGEGDGDRRAQRHKEGAPALLREEE